MKQNLIVFLADLFNLLEIHPVKCVRYPGMDRMPAGELLCFPHFVDYIRVCASQSMCGRQFHFFLNCFGNLQARNEFNFVAAFLFLHALSKLIRINTLRQIFFFGTKLNIFLYTFIEIIAVLIM